MRGVVAVSGSGMRWVGGFLVLTALVCTASATVVTSHPDAIERGDTVYVDISQCSNGSLVSLLIEGAFSVQPGGSFTFEVRNFLLPLSLEQGEVSADADNVQWARFSVKKGNTTISLTSDASNGTVHVSEAYDVSAGTYDFLKIEGGTLPDRDHVLARFQLTGIKAGPDTAQVSFIVEGITSGTVTVTMYVNAVEVLQKGITIGIPPTQPSKGAGAGGGDSGSGASELSGEGTGSTTPIPTTTQIRTFTSVDGNVSLIVAGTMYAGILKVEGDTPPPGWIFVGPAYAVSPSNLTFAPPGTLSVTLPMTVNASTTTLTLASWENGSWRMVPSKIVEGRITAMITAGGVYVVLTPALVEATAVPPTLAPTTPSATTTPASSPPFPLELGIVLSAAAIAVVGWHRFRS